MNERFAAVFDNDDVKTYAAAQRVTKDEFSWLEEGITSRRTATAVTEMLN